MSSVPAAAASLFMSATNSSRESHVISATPSYGTSWSRPAPVTRFTTYDLRFAYPSRAIAACVSSQYRPNSSADIPSDFRNQMCTRYMASTSVPRPCIVSASRPGFRLRLRGPPVADDSDDLMLAYG